MRAGVHQSNHSFGDGCSGRRVGILSRRSLRLVQTCMPTCISRTDAAIPAGAPKNPAGLFAESKARRRADRRAVIVATAAAKTGRQDGQPMSGGGGRLDSGDI